MKIETTEDVVSIVVDLPVPPEQAWALLTERSHTANWWGAHVDLQPRTGGAFLEKWSDGAREVITSGEVTRCDPPFALELTWADHDWPADTRVTFFLSGHGDRTRLALDHSGWGGHPPGGREELIRGHAHGWSLHLARLAEYATEVGPKAGKEPCRENQWQSQQT